MRRPKQNGFTQGSEPNRQPPQEPKRPYLAAVNQLAQKVPDIRAVFDKFGHLRNLTTDSMESALFDQPLLTAPAAHAQKFLGTTEVHKALGLRHVELGAGSDENLGELGVRVTFPQVVTTVDGQKIPVRGGSVQVFVLPDGKIFNVNSTLRHGRRTNLSLEGLISDEQAIAAARAHLRWDNFASERAELTFSSHNNRLDPVYEVVLTADNPRRVMQVLVKAASGEVVFERSLLRFFAPVRPEAARRTPASVEEAVVSAFVGEDGSFIEIDELPAKGKARKKGGKRGKSNVPGKSFLRIPDPNTALIRQLYDVVIESLPDPTVLANENFTMYVGSKRTPVKAKADGTFNYIPNDPRFSAVVTFFCLNIQMILAKQWGLTPNKRPIPVVVEDHSVTDNAYFDPEAYDIHIGIGTGVNAGGLSRYIAYDMGVFWHENGHHIVFLQTPGHDLPGVEGEGSHEAVGDMWDLLMDWWFRSKFTRQLGAKLTVADVVADRRVIGLYALPPDGIRIQKNSKRTPDDKTGEPHDDGLIVGGAMADTMVGIVVAQNDVEPALECFGRLLLAALALVPEHKVTWRDLLSAFLTADTRLNKGANKQLITRSFADHGITLKAARKRSPRAPVIVIEG